MGRWSHTGGGDISAEISGARRLDTADGRSRWRGARDAHWNARRSACRLARRAHRVERDGAVSVLRPEIHARVRPLACREGGAIRIRVSSALRGRPVERLLSSARPERVDGSLLLVYLFLAAGISALSRADAC